MRREAIMAGVGALLALSALGASLGTETPDDPSRPAEDSCDVDHRDGGWIVEVTP